MTSIAPPFTKETAHEKVKAIQNLWNEQNADKSAAIYTTDATVRAGDVLLDGNDKILGFLKKKFANEKDYTLRKELFAYDGNKISAQYWNEFRDGAEAANGKTVWKRTYGLENWTFGQDGRMVEGHMGQKEIVIDESDRWFKDAKDIDAVKVPF